MRLLKVLLFLLCLAIPLALGVPAGAALDVETGAVTDERLQSGVPLGGIGAGKVELLSDGTLGNLTTNNNWERPIAELPGSFFAIRAGKSAQVLALRSPYRFPTATGLRYQGDYPMARLRYSTEALPVDVSLLAHTPLLPHNLKDSSLPVAGFTFTLSNPGKSAIETSVAFSWENVLGVGGNSRAGWNNRTGAMQKATSEDGRTGVTFTIPGEDTGARRASLGEYAILGEAEEGKVSTLVDWNAAGDGRDFWSAFTAPTPFSGSAAGAAASGATGERHPAAAVAVTVTVPPGGSTQVYFTLGWRMPGFTTGDGVEHQPAYQEWFPTAWSAAAYASRYRDTLLSGTQEWQDLLLTSTLPGWFKHQLTNDLYPLSSNTLSTRAGEFSFLEALSERDGALGALDQWLVARRPLGIFYPELDRKELARFGALQAESGEVRRTLGNRVDGFGATGSPNREGNRPDVACNYVLALYRQYRWSGDTEAAKADFPSVRRALAWLKTLDTDEDGLPEGATTWEYRPVAGTFSYTAGLYLAALKAGEALAKAAGERGAEDQYRDLFRLAQLNAVAQLWNGRYLTASLNPENGERGSTLFAGALAGQWATDSLGLPPVLEPEVNRAALRSMLDLLPNAAAYTPPNEVRQDGSLDPRLSEVSWPGYLETFVAAPGIAADRADVGLALTRRVRDVQLDVSRNPWDTTLGYDPRTAQRVGPRSHISAMASWNVYAALTGFVPDEPEGKLRVAPRLPASWNGLRAPLFTSRYWAWMDFARSEDNAATNLRLKLLKKFDDRPVMLTGFSTTAPAGAKLEDLTLLLSGPGGTESGMIEAKSELVDGIVNFTFKQPYEWRLGETLEATLVPANANNLVVTFDPDGTSKVRSYGSRVLARDLTKDDQIKFTLVNPARERQVVNVRFGNTKDRNFEVWQNGVAIGRFTPDTPDERLPLVVPGSPVSYERIAALRGAKQRLTLARERAKADGQLAALGPQFQSLEAKIDAAVTADEAARSTPVVLHPLGSKSLGTKILGTRIIKNKLKDPPPMVEARDPETAVATAEAAIAAMPRTLTEQVQDLPVRGLVLDAIQPIRVNAEALDPLTPGGTTRVRYTVHNDGTEPTRVVVAARYPEGWTSPAELPRLTVEPGATESVVGTVQLPATFTPGRFPVEGFAIVAVDQGSWSVPLTGRIGSAPLREWSLVGPWSAAAGLDEALPPDRSLEANDAYGGRRWTAITAPGPRIDLAARFSEEARSVAYAFTQVYSPAEKDVILELSSDGGFLVRVNGEAIYARATGVTGTERIPVKLKAGWNQVLLKLARRREAWGFTAEITERNGDTPTGFRSRSSFTKE